MLQKNVQEKIVSKYVAVIAALFIALAILARFIPYFPLDLLITRGIQNIHAGWFYMLMNIMSFFGYPPQVYIIVIVISLAVFLTGLRWEAIMLIINAISISVVSLFLKMAIHRARPGIDLVHVFKHLSDYSFPSGHVLFYTSFFGFLFFLIYSLMKKSFIRDGILSLLGLTIILIAPSRIYLGDHWASDVLGAYMFGSLWLLLIIRLYRMGKKKIVTTQPTAK